MMYLTLCQCLMLLREMQGNRMSFKLSLTSISQSRPTTHDGLPQFTADFHYVAGE